MPPRFANNQVDVAPDIRPGAEQPSLSFGEQIDRGELTNEQIAEYLRQEIGGLKKEPTERTVLDLCHGMHHFIIQGVQAQNGHQPSPGLDLVVRSRYRAYPTKGKIIGDNDEQLNAWYYRGTVAMTEEAFARKSPHADLIFKDPRDVRLLRAAATAAHEMGHAMTDAASRMIYGYHRPEADSDEVDFALTREYTRDNPQQAVTGHFDTDVRINEERMANAFKGIGVTQLMQTLGYSRAEIKRYLETQRHLPDYGADAGHNQIDMLEQITAEQGPHDLLPEEAPASHRNNPGRLGYPRPFTAAELVSILDKATDSMTEDKPDFDPEAWPAWVQAVQDPNVRSYVAELRTQRTRALNPEHYTRRRRLLNRAAAVVMLLAIGAGGGKVVADWGADPKESATYPAEISGSTVREIDAPAPNGNPFVWTTEQDAMGRPIVNHYTK